MVMAESSHAAAAINHGSPSLSQKVSESRMALNDNKAGMEGLDKEKITRIILEASKGSKFYENELKKDKMVVKRIEVLKNQLKSATETQLRTCLQKADSLLVSLRLQYDFSRYIVHLDMDAFYAAVEMRDNPSLRDLPMAVGGEDMLSTSNYAARRYGVRAAMPGFIARKLCPQLVIIPTNFRKYRAVSKEMRKILRKYDVNASPMSLDEAYIDFTNHMSQRHELSEECRTFPEYSEEMCRCEPVGRIQYDREAPSSVSGDDESDDQSDDMKQNTNIQLSTDVCSRCGQILNQQKMSFGLGIEDAVREMRHRIHLKTKLTASAGIAANCLLAKICSDKNKPNGQYSLAPDPDAIQKFMSDLPIRKVPGIGKVSEKQLISFGVKTCKDFYTHRDVIFFLFSEISFDYFMSVYLGLGSNHVSRNEDGPKSKSVERTFGSACDPAELMDICRDLSVELSNDLKKSGLCGRTVTLKIKLVTFEQKTRAQSISFCTDDSEEIYKVAAKLLKTEIKLSHPRPLKLRLMGVRMSNFHNGPQSKQKKLSLLKANNTQRSVESEQKSMKTTGIGRQQSFFDMVDKEKTDSTMDEPKSVGLLAYMSQSDKLIAKHGEMAQKGVYGIQKFAQKRKDIWQDVETMPSNKRPKPGTKGPVTLCSLLDCEKVTDIWSTLDDQTEQSRSDSSNQRKCDLIDRFIDTNGIGSLDPWRDLHNIDHHSSTPRRVPRHQGPLDNYRTDSIHSPWSDVSSISEVQPLRSPNKSRDDNQVQTASKSVTSYFKKTKSVWSESSAEDDIICQFNSKDSESRKHGKGRGKSGGGRGKSGGGRGKHKNKQQSVVTLSQMITKPKKRKYYLPISRPPVNEVIVIDSD